MGIGKLRTSDGGFGQWPSGHLLFGGFGHCSVCPETWAEMLYSFGVGDEFRDIRSARYARILQLLAKED